MVNRLHRITLFAFTFGLLLGEVSVAWSQDVRMPSFSDDRTLPEFCHVVSTAGNNTAIDDLTSIEQRLQTAYERVSPCIVEILYGEHDFSAGSGVIVSAEGHILASSSASSRVIDNKLLRIRLAGGHIVGGQALGWSSEWGIGMLKIEPGDRQPFVELGDGSRVSAGDLCIALGYQQLSGVQRDKRSTLRFGTVTLSAGKDWFQSTCDLFAGGYSVFDLDGKLIGLTLRVPQPVHTNVERIKENWDELFSGENVGLKAIKQYSVWEKDGDDVASHNDKRAIRTVSEAQLIDRLKQATVKIDRKMFSGVIVTEDGFIVTCAHHNLPPGDAVTVSLSNGRDVHATVLGSNKVIDAGLIKITDEGKWPYVEMGNSFAMNPGDSCIKIGYPVTQTGQRLTIARSEITPSTHSLPRRGEESPVRFWSKGSSEMTPGSSGGGVFDSQGRLVGVILGTSGTDDDHLRIEQLRKHWDTLAAAPRVDVLDRDPLNEVNNKFRQLARSRRTSTIKILCDGKQRVVGTVVSADGLILTKLSELYGTVSCKLVDGRIFPATIVKKSQKHDLAILKIDASGLPVVQWAKNQDCTPGTLVAAVLPGQKSKAGVISLAPRPSPSADGWLGVDLKDGDEGVVVSSTSDGNQTIPLRAGDLVTSINGHPIVDYQSYAKLTQMEGGVGNAGEEIRVKACRDGKERVFRYNVPPSHSGSYKQLSSRWWGYPIVAGTDIRLAPLQCGCPLINQNGRAVGIYLACRSDFFGWGLRHVVPAHIVTQFVADLK